MARLDGRRILITGAASGMGREIADLFAAEGAALALLDRDEAGAAKVAAAVQQQLVQQKELLAKVSALPRADKEGREVLMGQLKMLSAAIEQALHEQKKSGPP